MRKTVLALPLLLAACASPFEICVANANQDLRVIDRLIAETRGNIQRGYGFRTKETYATEQQPCGEQGGKTIYCETPVVISEQVPVAIDMAAERAKLASLLETRARKQTEAGATVAACRRQHPEG